MAIAVFFAEGFEEIEALTVVDLARREGLETWMVSVTGKDKVTGSHGIVVEMDKLIEEVDFSKVEMIVLPGGMPGTLNLKACRPLMDQVMKFHQEKRYLAAICAAPTIFGELGILEGKEACCYPGMEEQLKTEKQVTSSLVVADHILTSRGMGTAITFGLKIIEIFLGKERADQLGKGIVYYS